MENMHKTVLLEGVTTNTTSTAHNIAELTKFTIFIESTNVTTGCDVTIEVKTPRDTWVPLDGPRAITTDGSITVRDDHASFLSVRALVSNYVDGTHSVSLSGSKQ